MKRVTEPLATMGAQIETAEGGTAPLHIRPVAGLRGMDYDMPVASAQVKSCLLLAGLYATGRDLRDRAGADARSHRTHVAGLRLRGAARRAIASACSGGGSLRACDIDVPADISSAAFFLVGASIAPGSDLLLEHVGMNPTRDGVINILRLMGADIEVSNAREVGGEPVADLRVRSAPLKGIRIPQDQVPLAIDEFPVLFVAAACAQGETVLTGAEELRVKESDRIQVMADGLGALGVDARPTADGIVIQGGEIGGGRVDSHGDHRIAMAFTHGRIACQRRDRHRRLRQCEYLFPGLRGTGRRRRFATWQCSPMSEQRAGHYDRWPERFGQGHGRPPGRRSAWMARAGLGRPVPAGWLCR